MNKNFPIQMWRLTPGFQPKEVTLVGEHKSYLFDGYRSETVGQYFSIHEVWPTKAEAISAGHVRLDKQIKDLEKKKVNIDKRRAALTKAALG